MTLKARCPHAAWRESSQPAGPLVGTHTRPVKLSLVDHPLGRREVKAKDSGDSCSWRPRSTGSRRSGRAVGPAQVGEGTPSSRDSLWGYPTVSTAILASENLHWQGCPFWGRGGLWHIHQVPGTEAKAGGSRAHRLGLGPLGGPGNVLLAPTESPPACVYAEPETVCSTRYLHLLDGRSTAASRGVHWRCDLLPTDHEQREDQGGGCCQHLSVSRPSSRVSFALHRCWHPWPPLPPCALRSSGPCLGPCATRGFLQERHQS